MDEQELVKRIKRGETALLNTLIEHYYPDIYRYCYRYMSNVSDAEDITQEVFLRFCKGFSEYTHQNKCKNFLYVIAGNLCKNALSKKSALFLDEMSQVTLATADEYKPMEQGLALEQELKLLPFEQQELLLLRYYQDLKFTDIAKITNTPVSTIKYKLKKSVLALKANLKKEDWT